LYIGIYAIKAAVLSQNKVTSKSLPQNQAKMQHTKVRHNCPPKIKNMLVVYLFLIDAAADLKAQGKYLGFFLASVLSKTLHGMRFCFS